MKRTALIVDDDINGLSAVGRVLATDGYMIATALSAELAWELLSTEVYDAVVCDEQLPGMQGSEFLALVAERCPQAVRVLVSGHARVIEREKFVVHATRFRFLQKPCSADALRAILDDQIAQRPSAEWAPGDSTSPSRGVSRVPSGAMRAPTPPPWRTRGSPDPTPANVKRAGWSSAAPPASDEEHRSSDEETPVRLSRATETLLRGAVDLSQRVRRSGTMRQVSGKLRQVRGRVKELVRTIRETESPAVARDPRRATSRPPQGRSQSDPPSPSSKSPPSR